MSDNDRIVVFPTENLDFKKGLFWKNAIKINSEIKQQIQMIQAALFKVQFFVNKI
jgi:hypothetical protein